MDEGVVDTGILEAAGVTPEPPPVTATVTPVDPSVVRELAKGALKLPDISNVEMAKLAREIAMDIRERSKILQDFKLDKSQYDFLCDTPYFKQALETALKEWNSALSTPERIRLGAAAILEETLPRLGARMGSQSEGLKDVVEAAKVFSKLAGFDDKQNSASLGGERVKITINLGGDAKIEYDNGGVEEASSSAASAAIREDDEGGGNPEAVRAISEGENDKFKIRLLTEGDGEA